MNITLGVLSALVLLSGSFAVNEKRGGEMSIAFILSLLLTTPLPLQNNVHFFNIFLHYANIFSNGVPV